MDRNKVIIKTSIIGIIANIFLVGFKIVVGFAANSIAIILDAVNNLSDALSSVITIIGAKLAGKAPDKKHPLGYGRIEYLSTMIVAAIVLYAGITAFIESFKKIIDPVEANYTTITIIILVAAVIVKLVLGLYVKKTGKKVNSGSLIASGSDALFDAILSTSVLVSAIVFLVFKVSIEAYIGIIISAFIIKSGIEMFRDAVNEMLGKRLDREYLADIKKTICENENVYGAYDLILHSYGPERFIGSVHVEIPEDMSASEIDALERELTKTVYEKHGVMLGGIGIYTFNSSDEEAEELRKSISELAMNYKGILQLHGFYFDRPANTVNFDVIVDFGLKTRHEIFDAFCAEVKKMHPGYEFNITLDLDI